MSFIQGGKANIGSANPRNRTEFRPFRTEVKSFYLDINEVTVGEFQEFVSATGYRTDAEKFGNAGVFDFSINQWSLVDGAYWKYPSGIDKELAKGDHPATQISWNDACAYCKWKDKRLPTEYEWEYAAKGGKQIDITYCWGDELNPKGEVMANYWQGSFPGLNKEVDKYFYTAPVGTFASNSLGINDLSGNVWEWVNDTYRPNPANQSALVPEMNKVLRGGSFLCDTTFCYNFRTTSRTFMEASSANFHNGFRCAMGEN